jgi:gas vesicle protein
VDKRFSYQDFGIGVITGLAIGAVAGILLAPESGKSTRQRLADQAGNLKMSAHDLIENAKNNLDLATQRLEGAFGTQERQLRKRLGELKAELEKYNLSGA